MQNRADGMCCTMVFSNGGEWPSESCHIAEKPVNEE